MRRGNLQIWYVAERNDSFSKHWIVTYNRNNEYKTIAEEGFFEFVNKKIAD